MQVSFLCLTLLLYQLHGFTSTMDILNIDPGRVRRPLHDHCIGWEPVHMDMTIFCEANQSAKKYFEHKYNVAKTVNH